MSKIFLVNAGSNFYPDRDNTIFATFDEAEARRIRNRASKGRGDLPKYDWVQIFEKECCEVPVGGQIWLVNAGNSFYPDQDNTLSVALSHDEALKARDEANSDHDWTECFAKKIEG